MGRVRKTVGVKVQGKSLILYVLVCVISFITHVHIHTMHIMRLFYYILCIAYAM